MNHPTTSSHSGATCGTLHYPAVPQATGTFWLAVLVAIGLHALFLLCLNGHPLRLRIAPPRDLVKIVEWNLPPTDDPPVVKPTELPDSPPAVKVPALLDVPQPVVIDTDFQQLAEPLTAPDIEIGQTLTSIPVGYERGPGTGEAGDIFTIKDLDRAPEPVARISPDYPIELNNAGIEGSVRIRFVVDTTGRVDSPQIVSSTDRGFEQAALRALARWKFRPGMKNGAKVKTRMEQQIDFTLQP